MLENTSTVGSIETSDASKRAFAKASLGYNMKDSTFLTLFPHMAEVYNTQQAEWQAQPAAAAAAPLSVRS